MISLGSSPTRTGAYGPSIPKLDSSASHRHIRKNEFQRNGCALKKFHLHKCGAHSGRRRVVEGMTDEPPQNAWTGKAINGHPLSQNRLEQKPRIQTRASPHRLAMSDN